MLLLRCLTFFTMIFFNHTMILMLFQIVNIYVLIRWPIPIMQQMFVLYYSIYFIYSSASPWLVICSPSAVESRPISLLCDYNVMISFILYPLISTYEWKGLTFRKYSSSSLSRPVQFKYLVWKFNRQSNFFKFRCLTDSTIFKTFHCYF